MTAPDSRETAAPAGAVALSEAEALAALRMVAAMTGGEVWALGCWSHYPVARTAATYCDVYRLGYAVGRAGDLNHWPDVVCWQWLASDGLMRFGRIENAAGRVVLPLGRIDRGLGAIK